jgi:hypothetical protein
MLTNRVNPLIQNASHTKRPFIEVAQKRGENEERHPSPQSEHKKGKRDQDALLPHIEKTNPLPQEGSDVNFDRSFLYSKPLTLDARRRDQILLNFEERLNANNSELTDFEQKLLASDLGHLLKVATQVIDMRMDEQKETLESFKLLSEKMRHLRGEKSKVLNDMIENAKLKDTWTSISDMISFFGAGLGFATGTATIFWGACTGDDAFVKSGILSILGGMGSMSAKWMADKNYDAKYTSAVSFISTLLIGYSSFKTLPIPKNMGNTEIVKSFLQVMGVSTQSLTQYQISQANAEQYTIQAETSKLQFHHDKNKSKLTKTLGGLKMTELMNEIQAASKQLGEEDKLKERIARILSSGA